MFGRARPRSVGRLGNGAPVLFPRIAVTQRTQRQHTIEVPHLPTRSRLIQTEAYILIGMLEIPVYNLKC